MAYPYSRPPVQPNGQGMFNRPPTVPIPPPILPPPPVVPPPVALGVAAVLSVAAIAVTVGAAIEANRAEADLQKAKDLFNRLPVPPPTNTGEKRVVTPPVNNGQDSNATYDFELWYGSNLFDANLQSVGAFYFSSEGSQYVLRTNNGNSFLNLEPIPYPQSLGWSFRNIRRRDGNFDVSAGSGDVIQQGYNGRRDREKSKVAPPPVNTSGNTTNITNNTTVSNTTNNSTTNNTTTNNSSTTNNGGNTTVNGGSTTVNNTTVNTGTTPQGRTAPPPTAPVTSPPPPKTTPPPTKQPDKKEEEKKPASPPPTSPPPNNDNQTILQRLAVIFGIVSIIGANTQPEAQRLNSKNGSCDALNSPECTNNLKNDIKEPLLDKVNQNAGAISAIGATLSGINTFLTNSILPKLVKIQEFSEGVAKAAKLDKVYNFLTFITVIHNASMLSNSLATTLMDSLSLGLATGGIKDADDSPIDIQQIINKSVEDKVKEIIGVQNYTVLSTRWKAAVRVYQAGANIAYQVRSLWDSARSLQELTGANVGKIGNALRRDGVVSENAYTAMADNPLMVNSAMTKLQNLDEAASHLNSITSEAYGVTETVTQIKKDQDDFKKLVKESQPLASVPNDAAKAKDDAAKLASVSPFISNIDLVKP